MLRVAIETGQQGLDIKPNGVEANLVFTIFKLRTIISYFMRGAGRGYQGAERTRRDINCLVVSFQWAKSQFNRGAWVNMLLSKKSCTLTITIAFDLVVRVRSNIDLHLETFIWVRFRLHVV